MPLDRKVRTWTEEDADRFEVALRLLSDLIITIAYAGPAPGSDLHRELQHCMEQKQRLRLIDQEEIAAVLSQAPARLQQLRHRPKR